MVRIGFLSDHGQNAWVGVEGGGSTEAAAQAAIEAFEATGGAQVGVAPGREALQEVILSDGGAEVATQGGNGLGLGRAILADNGKVAAECGVVALRPRSHGNRGRSLCDDGDIAWATGRQALAGPARYCAVCERDSVVVRHRSRRCAERCKAAAAVMNDELADHWRRGCPGLRDGRGKRSRPPLLHSRPTARPGWRSALFGPDAHGDQNRAFAAPFDGRKRPLRSRRN